MQTKFNGVSFGMCAPCDTGSGPFRIRLEAASGGDRRCTDLVVRDESGEVLERYRNIVIEWSWWQRLWGWVRQVVLRRSTPSVHWKDSVIREAEPGVPQIVRVINMAPDGTVVDEGVCRAD